MAKRVPPESRGLRAVSPAEVKPWAAWRAAPQKPQAPQVLAWPSVGSPQEVEMSLQTSLVAALASQGQVASPLALEASWPLVQMPHWRQLAPTVAAPEVEGVVVKELKGLAMLWLPRPKR